MSRGNITKWLYVGLHIKRWLALLAIAVAIMGLGFAYILREVYVSYTFPAWAAYLTLQFIPRWLRGVLFISSALILAIFSGWQLNRSLAHALLPVSTAIDNHSPIASSHKLCNHTAKSAPRWRPPSSSPALLSARRQPRTRAHAPPRNQLNGLRAGNRHNGCRAAPGCSQPTGPPPGHGARCACHGGFAPND